jgi:hypothetical protein
MNQDLLLIINTILVAAIGYFLKKTFDKVETTANDVSEMKPKLDILWRDKIAPSNSPRQLNERGMDILNTSGIKEVVDQKKDLLLKLVKEKNSTNPYDTEIAISAVMMDLPKHCADIVDKLKQGAFMSGVDINTVLFTGAIYLRNLIFKELGFELQDLDIPGKS